MALTTIDGVPQSQPAQSITWIADVSGLPPSGQDGQVYVVGTTDTVWTWDSDTNSWVDTGIAGGDMLKAVYDINANSIVDKAEAVDDGVNSTSAAQVKTAYDHSQIVTGNPHDVDAFDAPYTPTTPADWPDPDPINVGQALDRVAPRVLELELGRILRVGYEIDATGEVVADVLGDFELVTAAAVINSVTSSSIPVAGRHHLVLAVSAVTTTGVVRLTGTSYDPTTGLTTPGDFEDITIGPLVNGANKDWYRTTKYWQGTVTIGGDVNTTADIVADTVKFEGWSPAGVWDLREIFVHYEMTTGNSPSFTITLWKYNFNTNTRTSLYSFTNTPLQAENPNDRMDLRQYASGVIQVDFDGSGVPPDDGERLILEASSMSRVTKIRFEITFDKVSFV